MHWKRRLDMTKEHDHMVFRGKHTRRLKTIIKNEESKTKLLQNQTLTINITRKQTKNKAARGGRSIRYKTLPKSDEFNSPGEQETTSAISREGWSHAADVLTTPDTSSDAKVLMEDPT